MSLCSQHLQCFYRHGLILTQMSKEIYIKHGFKIISLFKIYPLTGFASSPTLCFCIEPMHMHQYNAKNFPIFKKTQFISEECCKHSYA